VEEQEQEQKFKRWIWEKHRRKFTHHTVTVRLSRDCGASGNIGQYGLFLTHLFSYVTVLPPGKSTVLFGYIRGDDHWHGRHQFDSAFAALAAVACSDTSLEYPLEWERKSDVLDRLDRAGVPRDAWWTCDMPFGSKACGACSKCDAVKPRPKPKKLFVVEKAVAAVRRR
jgi:hypothetical protein